MENWGEGGKPCSMGSWAGVKNLAAGERVENLAAWEARQGWKTLQLWRGLKTLHYGKLGRGGKPCSMGRGGKPCSKESWEGVENLAAWEAGERSGKPCSMGSWGGMENLAEEVKLAPRSHKCSRKESMLAETSFDTSQP